MNVSLPASSESFMTSLPVSVQQFGTKKAVSTQSSAALKVTHKTSFNVKLYQVKILQMKSCCIVRFAALAKNIQLQVVFQRMLEVFQNEK